MSAATSALLPNFFARFTHAGVDRFSQMMSDASGACTATGTKPRLERPSRAAPPLPALALVVLLLLRVRLALTLRVRLLLVLVLVLRVRLALALALLLLVVVVVLLLWPRSLVAALPQVPLP